MATLDEAIGICESGEHPSFYMNSAAIASSLIAEPERLPEFATAMIRGFEQAVDKTTALHRAMSDVAGYVAVADLGEIVGTMPLKEIYASETNYGPLMCRFAEFVGYSGEALVSKILGYENCEPDREIEKIEN